MAFILRRNRDNVNIASSAAETLEIANLGFAALADEIPTGLRFLV